MKEEASVMQAEKPVVVAEHQELLTKATQVLDATEQLIHRSYLANLKDYKPLLPTQDGQLHPADTALFKLERLVVENRQSILESATAAYTALGAAGFAVFFLLESDGEKTDFYIGTRSAPQKMGGSSAGKLLQKTFNGHFPGSELISIGKSTEIQKKLEFLNPAEPATAVTAVTGIPALSVEAREHFVQGLERFLDAADGEVYSALILAEPVAVSELNQARSAFEVTASQLSPLLKQQLSYGINESEAVGLSLTEGISTSLAETVGQTLTKGTSYTENTSETTGSSQSRSTSATVNLNILKRSWGEIFGSKTPGSSTSDSTTTSSTSGKTTGSNESVADNKSDTTTTTNNQSSMDSKTATAGTSQQLSIESINKPVESLLKRIDQHLERLDEARTYGGWQTAAYFIGKDTETAEALGSTFLGLMRGQGSAAEDSSLATWNMSDKAKRQQVLSWLKNLTHPRFKPAFLEHTTLDYITPAALLSGRELAIKLSLPRRSAAAVTVLEVPAYGRSIGLLDLDATQGECDTKSNSILLGHLRHLWRDTPQPLHLALDKLCYHTLITGTTGVGKTTAVMSLLAQVHRLGIPFLAIEPAKGEYRKLLGLADAQHPVTYRVVGRTGPDALRINPLVFPEGIELSDHVDRVCTVFNAAFPMYAAMPQVLEEAIFTAYEELGWDSISSTCVGGEQRFPTLRRIADLIPQVVQQLGYSEQVSSDYIGSLSTRLRSLCRGSLGMTLLCSAEEETTDNELFETSAVVDLSPMGSPEKRALLMGVLFMRMYEKRMAEGLPSQTGLRHLMVLEEAHVLLKRTSTDQSQEGSNPRGLAVEAFANALAEMRAYGQGFIVADQSASALDDAVLRNTNTKIVMRAPFEADRLALGGALALNEEQTQQLSRLENQTAVVHQSNWLEPVLCRIQREAISEAAPCIAVQDSRDDLRNSRRRALLALWRGRIGDLVTEKLSLNESEIDDVLACLAMEEKACHALRQVLFKVSDPDWQDLKLFTPLLIPALQDTAIKTLTVSEQGQLNSLRALLEQELSINGQLNRAISQDIFKLLKEIEQ